jgi:hypothetical protein
MSSALNTLRASSAAALIAAALLSGCASSDSSTPPPLQTPRSLRVNASIDDGIRWLEEAGLEVERIEDDSSPPSRAPWREIQRITVNGYDRAWVIRYDEPPADSALIDVFSLYGDFAAVMFPQTLRVGNIVYLVRGVETDAPANIFVAVWDMAPSAEINHHGAYFDGWSTNVLSEVTEQTAERLNERTEMGPFVAVTAEPVLATMRSFAEAHRFDPLVGNMPNPETIVWVNQFRDTDSGDYVTVASELTSGILVGEIRASEPLDLSTIDATPAPLALSIEAVDGSRGEFDELHTLVELTLPLPVEHTTAEWSESAESVVIERTAVGSDEWAPIAWLRNDARDMTAERPTALVPPGGRAFVANPEAVQPLISYWDYDVIAGAKYSYRVYACTSFGRRTEYSQTVSAVAGDPDPSTPDIAAHRPPVVTEVNCSAGRG